MYTKEDLKEYLKAMGLTGKETILVHSSMKSIGEVEGRADTVLDALIEYFKDGLLLLPTHTWKNINEDNPVYDPAVTGNTFTSPNTQYGRNRCKCQRISCR